MLVSAYRRNRRLRDGGGDCRIMAERWHDRRSPRDPFEPSSNDCATDHPIAERFPYAASSLSLTGQAIDQALRLSRVTLDEFAIAVRHGVILRWEAKRHRLRAGIPLSSAQPERVRLSRARQPNGWSSSGDGGYAELLLKHPEVLSEGAVGWAVIDHVRDPGSPFLIRFVKPTGLCAVSIPLLCENPCCREYLLLAWSTHEMSGRNQSPEPLLRGNQIPRRQQRSFEAGATKHVISPPGDQRIGGPLLLTLRIAILVFFARNCSSQEERKPTSHPDQLPVIPWSQRILVSPRYRHVGRESVVSPRRR